jgi:DNA polymerase-3 subunit delta
VSNSCTALELLADPPGPEWAATAAVVAVTSTEPFFVHHVLSLLRDRLCPDEDDRAWAWREFIGDDLEDGRDVFDEAATIPMFATATRAAVVRAADAFVTRFREPLEKLAGTSRGRRGVVILEVKSLPSNTKLAKAIAKAGVIVDTAIPPKANLASWLVAWAKSHHGRAIQKATAERLLDRLDSDLGQIDQAIARLAAAGGTGAIPPEAVDEIAMGPKERSAGEMVDLAASGRAAAAISHLADLIESGESPIGIAAQVASVLKRVSAAARLLGLPAEAGRPAGINDALKAAGVAAWPKAMDQAAAALRQLGPRRARSLPVWILETDRALKGEASRGLRAQLAIERLFCKMVDLTSIPNRPPNRTEKPRA